MYIRKKKNNFFNEFVEFTKYEIKGNRGLRPIIYLPDYEKNKLS